MAQLTFNATNIKPMGIGASQLPVSGKEGHVVMITGSEMVENAAKTGGFLALNLTVTEGPSKGEEGIYRLNIFHETPKVQEIAYAQLSAVCHVTGVFDVKDTQQLHNIPFRAVVALQKGDNEQGYTEIKGVLHSDGAAPGKSTGGAPATPPPAAEGGAAPWTAPAAAAGTAAAATPAWAQPK